MGVSDLRDAFNSVAEPRYSCQRAFMSYSGLTDGGQFQILRFSGRGSDGNGFEVESDPIAPRADLILAAKATAQKLIERVEPLT